MKFILVQCDEGAVLTAIPKGAAVTVVNAADPTITLAGVVFGHLDAVEPDPPAYIPHNHATGPGAPLP